VFLGSNGHPPINPNFPDGLFARHEFVNLDGTLALDRYSVKLFRPDLKVLAFADFVTFDDVGALDFVPGISVNLAILDPIAGLLVKLVKTDLLSLTGRRRSAKVIRRKRASMAVTALKRKPEAELKTYHATVVVTRAEEWCVEAESPEEARELLAAGLGHRCHLGERIQFEVESVEE
jgi:hypothetical protein